jgi:hypothetical protein
VQKYVSDSVYVCVHTHKYARYSAPFRCYEWNILLTEKFAVHHEQNNPAKSATISTFIFLLREILYPWNYWNQEKVASLLEIMSLNGLRVHIICILLSTIKHV